MEKGLWLHVLRGAGSVIFQFTAIRGSRKVPQGEDQTKVKMPKLSIDWCSCTERFPSMESPDVIVQKSLEIRTIPRWDCPEKPGNKEKAQRSVPMRHPCNAVLLVRHRQTDAKGVTRGGVGADWWPQLSQRRGTQADSWPPVAPDATAKEARGIVFHSGGQSAAQGSGHCSSQPGKQARGSKQSSRKESLCK